MSLAIRKSEAFLADLDAQFRWYEREAGWDVAWRYLLAADEVLEKLAEHRSWAGGGTLLIPSCATCGVG